MSNPSQTEQNQQPTPEVSRPRRLARWLRRNVALLLIGLFMILLSPFLYRAYRISSIPQIGDPFDVAEFEAIAIPSNDNAVEIYAIADAMLVRGEHTSEHFDQVFEAGWDAATEELKKLLTANERALEEWRRGTERPTSQHVDLAKWRIDTDLPLVPTLKEFSRLARLRAERSLHECDVVTAWKWLRATVRSSRQLGQHGGFYERLTGATILKNAAQGINRWAAEPHVDENHLRNAAEQFDADDMLTPLCSVGMKHEYLSCLHTIESDLSAADLGALPTDDDIPEGVYSASIFIMGEPAYSRRLMQHVFTCWLENVDLPKWKRGKKYGPLGLYSAPDKPDRLSILELNSHMLSFSLARQLLPALSQVERATDCDSARCAALKLTLAAQRYYRRHGDWPGKLDDLATDFIKELPADPVGKAGETLLMKRDGDDLIIYSVGDNGIDDGGSVAPVENKTLDEGFRLKRPQSPSAEK